MNARHLRIASGDQVCIRGGAGSLVAVERGNVWLTQHLDRRDVVIEAGDSFRLDRAGTAVISTDASAALTVTAPAGATLPSIDISIRGARTAPVAARPAIRFAHPL